MHVNKDLGEENRVCLLAASRVYQLTLTVTSNKGHTQYLYTSYFPPLFIRRRKKYWLFPVTVYKRNWVGKSIKKKLHYFFGPKCLFYACFTLIGSWEGGNFFGVGFFLNIKCVRVGLQETNNFFRPYSINKVWMASIYKAITAVPLSMLVARHISSTQCGLEVIVMFFTEI